ncbi:hypothetical protein ACJX0J_016894, partial [Zea mays]
MGNVSGRAEDLVDADIDDGNNMRRASSSSAGYVRGGGSSSSPPASPPRPHSPRMFVPQSPVTPLQRATEVSPPVFNQILMNQQQEDSDGPPQKKIPTLLTCTLGGRNIYVEGSWDNWTSKKLVEKSGKDHTILLMLSSGVHRYRFIVDGERRFIPDLPCETDNVGQILNLVDVHLVKSSLLHNSLHIVIIIRLFSWEIIKKYKSSILVIVHIHVDIDICVIQILRNFQGMLSTSMFQVFNIS